MKKVGAKKESIYIEKTIYIYREIYRYNVYFGAKNNKKRVYLLLYIYRNSTF